MATRTGPWRPGGTARERFSTTGPPGHPAIAGKRPGRRGLQGHSSAPTAGGGLRRVPRLLRRCAEGGAALAEFRASWREWLFSGRVARQ
jgi:hypothetical protein